LAILYAWNPEKQEHINILYVQSVEPMQIKMREAEHVFDAIHLGYSDAGWLLVPVVVVYFYFVSKVFPTETISYVIY
jgi:hypothetical protein